MLRVVLMLQDVPNTVLVLVLTWILVLNTHTVHASIANVLGNHSNKTAIFRGGRSFLFDNAKQTIWPQIH